MRDTKANYLFKERRPPGEVQKIESIANDDPNFMFEWEKYMRLYKFDEIYLDNKLEELLAIFGRR